MNAILKKVTVLTGLFIGAFALSALADWSNPPTSPPTCPSTYDGCNPPINIGYGGQVKLGSLSLSGLLDSGGNTSAYGLIVNNSPIKAAGGFVIETRSSDPTSPETGRMWLIQ